MSLGGGGGGGGARSLKGERAERSRFLGIWPPGDEIPRDLAPVVRDHGG